MYTVYDSFSKESDGKRYISSNSEPEEFVNTAREYSIVSAYPPRSRLATGANANSHASEQLSSYPRGAIRLCSEVRARRC